MGRLNISLNNNALNIANEMVRNREKYKIDVIKKSNGTIIIDGGIKAEGSFAAGRYFAEICLAGLAEVSITDFEINGIVFPAVTVETGYPLLSCMASQYAGWEIKLEDYCAMASGPGRILAREEELFNIIDYHDDSDAAILVLETADIPSVDLCNYIAEKVNVKPENLFLLVARTASIVGSIQISARIVETGLHKMHELDFPITKIEDGWGICPVAPVSNDDLTAIGRTNDSVLYGGSAYYTVRADDKEIDNIIKKVSSQFSSDYGTKFLELFNKYNDFYKIDPMLFSPARVIINNKNTGSVFTSGNINNDILISSYLGDK